MMLLTCYQIDQVESDLNDNQYIHIETDKPYANWDGYGIYQAILHVWEEGKIVRTVDIKISHGALVYFLRDTDPQTFNHSYGQLNK